MVGWAVGGVWAHTAPTNKNAKRLRALMTGINVPPV
jgi:hypothetical protein